MKKILIFIIGAMMLSSCNSVPTLKQVEDWTFPEIQKYTDNSYKVKSEQLGIPIQHSIEQYWIDENPEPRVYTGYIRETLNTPFGVKRQCRRVKIKYRDNAYDFYTFELLLLYED